MSLKRLSASVLCEKLENTLFQKIELENPLIWVLQDQSTIMVSLLIISAK